MNRIDPSFIAKKSHARRPSGFTMVETLVAVAVLSIAMLGLGYSADGLAQLKIKAELNSGLSAIESALTQQLLNGANYDNSAAAELRAGAVPVDAHFAVTGSSMGKPFGFNYTPSATVQEFGFTRDMTSCTTYPDATCNMRLRVAYDTRGAFAYKLDSQHPKIGEAHQYSGVGSMDLSFQPSDFTVVIPHEYYYDRAAASELTVSCPSNPSRPPLGLRGFNRETGTVSGCISQPLQTCPDGTLAKQLTYNTSTASVEFVCGSPVQDVSCPAGYILQQLDTPSLDAGQTKSGVCVYKNSRSVSYGPFGPSKTVSGTVCPENYRSQSSCSLSDETSAPGNCPASCGAYDSDGKCTAPIAEEKNVPFNRGSASLSESGQSATCTVSYPNQRCGATWDAKVNLSVTCVLTVPETTNVQ